MTTPLSLSGLDLPRRNGELAFDAPWQSTVFALAAAVIEHASLPMLMIRPNRRACIPGSTPVLRQAAARTLTAKARSHSPGSVSSSCFHTA